MARKALKPWRRKQDKCWYTTDSQTGKKVKLAPAETSEAEARRLFHQYHAESRGRTEAGPFLTVSRLIDEYLEWVQQNRAPRTYQWYRDYLVRFHEFHGPRLRVAVLEPYHVTQWIQKDYKGQSDSHRKGAVRSIKRVLNWAVEERYIASNPIAHMKVARPQPRETTITDIQFKQALANYPPSDSFPRLSHVPLGNRVPTSRDTGD